MFTGANNSYRLKCRPSESGGHGNIFTVKQLMKAVCVQGINNIVRKNELFTSRAAPGFNHTLHSDFSDFLFLYLLSDLDLRVHEHFVLKSGATLVF